MDSDEDVTPAPVGRQQRHRAAPGHLINFDTSTQTPASEGVSTPGSAAPGSAERVLPTPARRTAPSFAPSPALSQSQSQSQSQEGVAVRETWTLPETEVFNKAYGEMLRNGQINTLGNIQVPPPLLTPLGRCSSRQCNRRTGRSSRGGLQLGLSEWAMAPSKRTQMLERE